MKRKKSKYAFILLKCDTHSLAFAWKGRLSVNHLYRSVKSKNRTINVAKAAVERLLKKQIEECSVQFEKYEAYDFQYTFIFGLSAKQDVSNFIKFIEDIIFNLFLCDDDCKVQRIVAEKFVCKGEYNVAIVTWNPNKKPCR